MLLVDFILNVAGVLVWLNWRASPGVGSPLDRPRTLVGTLKRAEPRPWGARLAVLSLVPLLVFRALVYHQIGLATGWTPALHFGGLPLVFRSDLFDRILLFSFISFGATLAVFYTGLILLSVLNRRPPTPDPAGRLIRMAMGGAGRMPAWVQMLAPLLGGLFVWLPLSAWLARIGMLPSNSFWPDRIVEGLLVGAALYLYWKYLLAAIFVIHIVNTYVDLGRHPAWEYADRLARPLLRPLRHLSLRAGKVDVAPMVALAAVLLMADRLGWLLGWIQSRLLL